MKQLTREQFQDQFQTRVEYNDYLAGILHLYEVFQNTPVYTALEKLVIIKDDGHYYMR